MNHEKRFEIFKRFQALNPAPKTELQYSSEFELLVAVILSAQATDVGVNKTTKILFNIANTPEKILALGEEGLKSYVKSINLYKTKAKHIIQTCKILIDEYNAQVPNTRESLMRLPGVGRKTANVILNSAFGHPEIAVDTHIFRVSNRTGLAKGKTVDEVEKNLSKSTPKEFLLQAHHWLVLHGRYICTARKPKCPQCPINDLCEFKEKNSGVFNSWVFQ